jgi:hypothetical protein
MLARMCWPRPKHPPRKGSSLANETQNCASFSFRPLDIIDFFCLDDPVLPECTFAQ